MNQIMTGIIQRSPFNGVIIDSLKLITGLRPTADIVLIQLPASSLTITDSINLHRYLHYHNMTDIRNQSTIYVNKLTRLKKH